MQAFTANSDQPLYADMRLSRYDQPLNVIRRASGLAVVMLADGLIVCSNASTKLSLLTCIFLSGSTYIHNLGQKSQSYHSTRPATHN